LVALFRRLDGYGVVYTVEFCIRLNIIILTDIIL
jgi:hypothetical protein